MDQVQVTHACNPKYSGGRKQEDHSSKPAWANSLQDPISKKPIAHKHTHTYTHTKEKKKASYYAVEE
jgi:hypothetical protein